MPGTRKHCIAIVEDDDDNRLMLRRFFTHNGYDVVEAVDATGAMAAAFRSDVDLLLLDVMLPGTNGLSVLGLLRSQGNEIPIILLTALTDPSLLARGFTLGADDYVTKPFSLPFLFERVQRRLGPQLGPRTLDHIDITVEDDSARAAAPSPTPSPTPSLIPSLTPSPIPSRPTDESPDGVAVAFEDIIEAALVVPAAEAVITAGVILGGRYRLEAPLDRGTFGEVWRAHHIDLESDVAVKILRADVQVTRVGESPAESFRREAVRACRVRHENAVQIVDYGMTSAGRAFLVMELLRGRTLRAEIQEGRQGVQRAAHVVTSVLRALAAAHRAGVVHHDVKADNVFLHQGLGGEVIKLIDFGAALEKTQNTSIIVGTPSHMAPERFEGEVSDEKGDVYAAGVLLYHGVTGSLPWVDGADDDLDTLRKRHARDPEPASKRAPVPPAVDAVIKKLMARKSSARPTATDAADLVSTLLPR